MALGFKRAARRDRSAELDQPARHAGVWRMQAVDDIVTRGDSAALWCNSTAQDGDDVHGADTCRRAAATPPPHRCRQRRVSGVVMPGGVLRIAQSVATTAGRPVAHRVANPAAVPAAIDPASSAAAAWRPELAFRNSRRRAQRDDCPRLPDRSCRSHGEHGVSGHLFHGGLLDQRVARV